MIREARGIGVVLLDAQIRLMVRQAVEHLGCVAHADIDDLRIKPRVLIGNVRVD